MADLIELHNRCAPWKPSPDSELVAQYRYYDVPLAGVIRQGDREFIFMCLDGETETISLWWYAHITPEQRAELESLEGAVFDESLRHMPFNGWTRLAFATTNLGVVDYEDVEDLPDGEGFRVALRTLNSRLDQLSEDAKELQLAF